jgi:hypothetical protein
MVWLVFTELLRNLLKLFLAGVLCYQWKQLLGELLRPRLPKIMVIRCFVNTPPLPRVGVDCENEIKPG